MTKKILPEKKVANSKVPAKIAVTKNLVGWDMTCNRINPITKKEIQPTFISNILSQIAKHWVFQEEIGVTGFEHFQCRVKLRKRASKSVLLKLIMTLCETTNASEYFQYIEPTSVDVHQTSNFNYMMKGDTRKAGTVPISDLTYIPLALREPEYIPDYMRDKTVDKFYPCQEQIFEYANMTYSKDRSFDRNVMFVIDRLGRMGKSIITHYINLHGGMSIPVFTDPSKIIEAVASKCIAQGLRSLKGIVIDLPRVMKLDRTFFGVIEVLKKGHLIDTRHKYREWYIDTPPIIVICNHLPDNISELLTNDMLNIFQINGETKSLERLNLQDLELQYLKKSDRSSGLRQNLFKPFKKNDQKIVNDNHSLDSDIIDTGYQIDLMFDELETFSDEGVYDEQSDNDYNSDASSE